MKKQTLWTVVALGVALAACPLWAQEKSHEGGAKPPAAAPKASAQDVAAAMQAVEDAKKLIAADKKAEALAKLDEAAKLLKKVETATTAPAATPAPAAAGESFTGTVETTHSTHRPRLVVGTTHYELSAAPSADPSVKATLDDISSGKATGTYTIKGTTTGGARPTIMVSSITKG